MSLHGPFSTMPLPEVLGWVASTNRFGVLTIRGAGGETMLRLRQGRVEECAASDPPVLLGQFLLFHGAITEDDLDRAMRAHASSGRRLGDVLVEIGAISNENLEEALAAKAEETVLGSFDHPTGRFVFDPDATALRGGLALDMPIADALARGAKRLADAASAAATLERPGHVLRKTSKTPSAKINSVWPLRSAYALVDGERTVDEIVLHTHGTRFHATQRLYQLCLEGFLELTPDVDMEAKASIETVRDGLATTDLPEASESRDLAGSFDTFDRVVPIALPREIGRQLDGLTNVEKYLLTLCVGTRDLRTITAIAPLSAQTVIDTIRSLLDRGLLKTDSTASGRWLKPN